jgi:predicted acetyltransferase
VWEVRNLFRKIEFTDLEIKIKLVNQHIDTDPNGWGHSYIFDIYELQSGKIVGRCDLRKGESETLRLAGHIGYTIYVPYRGHHYAAKACLLLFEFAKTLDMKEVIITCNTDNIASYKTCEYAGCRYLKEEVVPFEHELYAQGDRIKAIFVKTL